MKVKTTLNFSYAEEMSSWAGMCDSDIYKLWMDRDILV